MHVEAGLDPLKNCLARAEKQCAIDAFSKLQDSKLKDQPEYLDLSAQVMSLEGKKTEAITAFKALKAQMKTEGISGRLLDHVNEGLSH